MQANDDVISVAGRECGNVQSDRRKSFHRLVDGKKFPTSSAPSGP